MKIILFSSGNYGSFYLKKLLYRGHKVIAGVPNLKDKRFTKELKLKKIPIIELNNFKKKEECLEKLKKYNADIYIVCSFRIIPEYIWTIPPLKTINIHYSLLPSYRGPKPVYEVIKDKKKYTGVTILYIDNDIDNGDIIGQSKLEIFSYKFRVLNHRLNKLGASLLFSTLRKINLNQVKILKPKYPSFYRTF